MLVSGAIDYKLCRFSAIRNDVNCFFRAFLDYSEAAKDYNLDYYLNNQILLHHNKIL